MEKDIFGKMNENYFILAAVFLLGLGIGLAGVLICRRRMDHILSELLLKLDRALGGKENEVIYDETMDAAITERLNRLVQSSGMRQQQAEEERDSVKSLISDIAHQVRTPLSNILLYSQILQEDLAKGDIQAEPYQLAAKIQVNSEKLDFFMKELVKSSYIETEMISIAPEQVSLSELVFAACQQAEVAALKKKVEIKMEPFPDEDGCFADRKWTAEAIGNVLENAVKYSPEGSSVQIKVIPYDSFFCISVQDSGIGIAEEEQGLIFRRFYRSPAVTGTPGFGIGLYLVREVLSRQGGFVKVKSALGQGSEFQLFLSRRTEH
ncbi:MAG: HAMP domain-containing sensor histidine kinase [Lachnospiraceae bacterium]|nr:HAMP domain-containing sensor histidine kinase [Lachnospiraceae bacterium]